MKIHNGLVAQLTSVLLWVCATGYAPTLMWAQDPTVEWDAACANDDATNCTDWVVQPAYELVLGDPDCAANIHYKTRTCSTATGQVYKDYVITGWEYLNGCEGWDKKSKYEQSFDGLKDYILLGLLTQLEEINPAPCSLNPRPQIANVYYSGCGVWTCCEYEIVTTVNPVCDGYWTGPPPHYGNPPKVKACKWVPCGTVCCRRRYEVCFDSKEVEGMWYNTTDIKLIAKEKLGECSGQLPAPAQPCDDGC